MNIPKIMLNSFIVLQETDRNFIWVQVIDLYVFLCCEYWLLLFSPLSVCLLLTKSKDFVSILMTSVLCLFVCVLLTKSLDFVSILMTSVVCLFVCLCVFVTYEIKRFRKYINDFRPLFVTYEIKRFRKYIDDFRPPFVCVCVFVCLFVGTITRERKKLPMSNYTTWFRRVMASAD